MTLKIYNKQPRHFNPCMTVVGCYCRHDDRLLLLKRSPTSVSGETWCLPGGKREDGESRLEGARRELYEECGIELLPKQLFYLGTLYMDRIHYQYDFSIYHCSFTVKPSLYLNLREHTEGRWWTHQEAFVAPLIAGGKKVLDYCLQKRGESSM